MSINPDEILANELQKLAVKATNEERAAGVVGWAARKLPNDAYQLQFRVKASPEDVLRAASTVLQEKGRIEESSDSSPEVASLSGVVGSGFLGLNPALVTVQVLPTAEQQTDVIVAGVAKEGLIKQRGGEKAAKAVADRLRQTLNEVST